MEFRGPAKPLTEAGLNAALAVISFSPADAAYLWTVVEVETSGITQGFGFRADRRPHILFERHKFREFTNGRFDQEAADVSGPAGNYGSAQAQYDRLTRALDCCRRCGLSLQSALKSASWGLGQVMGFNHRAAGFPSAEAMVTAMTQGEDAQLMAMARFLEATGLGTHLRKRDWRRFAIGYNGPAQWKNQYEVKLAEQFARLSTGSTPSLRNREAQAALLYLGYAPGKIDGVLGPRSRAAVAKFRTDRGMPPSTDLDDATYQRLRSEVGWAS